MIEGRAITQAELDEFNEHAIPAGTAGLAKHRQPLPVEQEDQHLNADGDVCDCGEQPPQPGLVHYRRRVGAHSERVAYTPPKYGPPPGFSAEKWRSMSRKARRDTLKAMTRAINKTTK